MGASFRLFGTTTALIGGEERPVTAARQRAVLARLSLAPGVAVSADQLLTDVWGDNLPSGGAKAVAFQITKLRDLLEPDRDGPGTVITTDAAGYRLNVEPDEIDVARFGRLVANSRAALDDPEKAGKLAADALALWTAEPFADVDEQPWVSEEIARLQQSRMLAERTTVQTQMASGDHAGVIGELERLIRASPLEEGLVADYMTALSRSGRSADALRAFGDLRLRLGDELGIEPSNDLVALEHRILAREVPGAPTDDHSDTVGNVPNVATSFVGRTDAIARLDEALGRSPVAVLTGPGGSGKTRLALEYARRQRHAFPDGAWFVELAALPSGADVMAAIGESLGLRPGEGADIGEVVRRYLRRRKLLLVVDNCEHVVEQAGRAVEQVIQAAPDVGVLATSRESLGVQGEQLIPVPPLALPSDDNNSAEALELLIDRARQVGVENLDIEPFTRICVRLEGMPLAIELAAARLRTLAPEELARRLDDSLGALAASKKERTERHRTLRAAVEWSYTLLTVEEQTMLQRFSVFPTGFDLAAAEAVAGAETDEDGELLQVLNSLIDKSLVIAEHPAGSPTRYSLLVPVREFAGEELAKESGTDAVLLTHARHYAGVAAEAGPHTRGEAYPAWADRLRADLRHTRLASATLLANGDGSAALDMAIELHMFSIHNGMHRELLDLLLSAVADIPETDSLRRIKGWWVAALTAAEITDPAAVDHGRTGLEEANTTGDPNLIGRMELALGAAIRHTSDDPEFLSHLTEGRRLLDAHPEPYWWEPTWERGFLNFIMGAYFPFSDERGVEHFEIGIEALDQTKDRVLHAAILGDSAGLWNVADHDWILSNVRESVATLDRLDSSYWCGHSRIALGFVLLLERQPAEALEHFSLAGTQLMECGDINCWAIAEGRGADAAIELGALDDAHARIAEVIDSMDLLPIRGVHLARTLDTIAILLARDDRPEAAARVLGAAQQAPFPDAATIWPRSSRQAQLRGEIETTLGPSHTAELLAAGAGLGFDESVAIYRATLR